MTERHEANPNSNRSNSQQSLNLDWSELAPTLIISDDDDDDDEKKINISVSNSNSNSNSNTNTNENTDPNANPNPNPFPGGHISHIGENFYRNNNDNRVYHDQNDNGNHDDHIYHPEQNINLNDYSNVHVNITEEHHGMCYFGLCFIFSVIFL